MQVRSLVAQCSAIGVSVAATPPCGAIRFCKEISPRHSDRGGGKMGATGSFFFRDGETTIKVKFSLLRGGALGAERKIVQKRLFSWETPRQ